MTPTCVTQISNNASPLQTAGRAHRQYTLQVTRTAFALCAKAALTPQYTLTYNTLGNIVSRLYSSILHKRPQMLTMFDNPATFAGQFALTGSSFFKEFFHTIHRYREYLVYHRQRLTLTGVEHTGQNRTTILIPILSFL